MRISALGARLNRLISAAVILLVEGDSNTAGVGNWFDGGQGMDPALAAAGYAATTGANLSIGGSTWATLTDRQAACDAAGAAQAGKHRILLIMCGTNDIENVDHTAAQAFADCQTYVTARIVAGEFEQIWVISPPLLLDGAKEAVMADYRALLNSLTGVTRVVHPTSNPALMDPDVINSEDEVHLTDPGQQLWSDYVFDQLELAA